MAETTDLRTVLEAVRRHVERAAAGTGLQARAMTVELRFGLQTDDQAMVRPVLRTSEEQTSGAPHVLRLRVSLSDQNGG